jgi:hypothetical protein
MVFLIKLESVVAIAFFMLATALFAQSSTPTNPVQTFHVQGTIRDLKDGAVPGAAVEFEGETSKIVKADKKGFYEADLPIGRYKMYVNPLVGYLQRHERPLFRIALPTSLTLNVIPRSVSDLRSCDALA